MESTLERLLRIQGQPEQQSMRIEEKPPAPAAEPSGASPAMLDAWRSAYRVFTKFAARIRAAAGSNDQAAMVFLDAAKELSLINTGPEDARILAEHVYGMLEDVYKAATSCTTNNATGCATGERNTMKTGEKAQ